MVMCLLRSLKEFPGKPEAGQSGRLPEGGSSLEEMG